MEQRAESAPSGASGHWQPELAEATAEQIRAGAEAAQNGIALATAAQVRVHGATQKEADEAVQKIAPTEARRRLKELKAEVARKKSELATAHVEQAAEAAQNRSALAIATAIHVTKEKNQKARKRTKKRAAQQEELEKQKKAAAQVESEVREDRARATQVLLDHARELRVQANQPPSHEVEAAQVRAQVREDLAQKMQVKQLLRRAVNAREAGLCYIMTTAQQAAAAEQA